MPTNLSEKITNHRNITRFRGAPHELLATLPPDIACRVTVTRTPMGIIDTKYTYSVHETRDLACRKCHKSDNSVTLLVR